MNFLSKQGRAAAIGLGFWFCVALVVNIWHSVPMWIFVLCYVVGACWLTGWLLIWIARFVKWIAAGPKYDASDFHGK